MIVRLDQKAKINYMLPKELHMKDENINRVKEIECKRTYNANNKKKA